MKQFYLDLKGQINQYLPELKGNTYKWNNQFNHSNLDGEDGRNEAAFAYPVVFIELNDMTYQQLSMGVQEVNFTCTIRLGYKSLLKEDNRELDLLDRLYWVCERFQSGNSARLTRVNETWDTNKSNVSITTIVYNGYTRDNNRYVLGNEQPEFLTGFTSTEIFVPALSGGTSYSGITDDNGNNRYQQ